MEATASLGSGEAMVPAKVIEAPPPGEPPANPPVLGESPRLARNLSALFGGQLVTWSITLLWTLIVPRLIGPAGLGVINTAVAVSGVLLIFVTLAPAAYLVQEIVTDPPSAPQLLGTATVLKLLISPVVVVTAIVFASVAHYSAEQRIAIYLAAVGNIAFLLIDTQTGGFQALERMKYLALGGIINKVGQSLIGIGLALCGLGAVAITANITVLGFVAVAAQFVWLRRYVKIDFRTNTRLLRAMVRKSLPYWAGGLAFTIYLQIDMILLSLMTNSKEVGWYAAATTLVATFSFLPMMAAQTWLPRFVAAFKHNRGRLVEAARPPVEWLLLASIPIAIAIAMASTTIMHVLYGSSYIPAGEVMAILAFWLPPMYFNTIMVQVFVASGRQLWTTYIMIGAAVVNPLLNLVLIPLSVSRYHNGAIGAAVALVVTEVLHAITRWVLVGRHICDRRMIRRCVLVIAASAAMWTGAYLSRPLGSPISLAIGVFTLLLLIVLLRIPTHEEVSFIRRTVRRVSPAIRARLKPAGG